MPNTTSNFRSCVEAEILHSVPKDSAARISWNAGAGAVS